MRRRGRDLLRPLVRPADGKARNRDPDRWTDFAPHRIRLNDTGWSYEPIERQGRGKGGKDSGKVQPGSSCSTTR